MRTAAFLEASDAERGTLLAIDFEGLPFTPMRVFVVNAVPPGTVRGGHGPMRGRQILVNLGGPLALIVDPKGSPRTYIGVDAPGVCAVLLAGDVAWQRYDAGNRGLLVLCDSQYDPEDYVKGDSEPGEEEWGRCRP